jgi:hypothetical protein
MYSLADFAAIQKRMNYTLPLETKQKIHALCKSIGAELPFTMTQDKKDIHDSIREINKLTEENKDKQFLIILSILKENEKDIPLFSNELFKMIKNNSFFSKVYAELYSKLYWSTFQDVFEAHYNSYLQSFGQIETCDAEDYELYCQLKKKNDERRAFTLFLCNLVQQKTITMDYYNKTMTVILEHIDETLSLDKKDVMNEYIENVYILCSTVKIVPTEKIKWLSELNPKQYNGLNYKIIFRCMDIIKLTS